MSCRRALVTAFDTDLATKRYFPLRFEPELVENRLPEEVLRGHSIFRKRNSRLHKFGKMGLSMGLVILCLLAVTGKWIFSKWKFGFSAPVNYLPHIVFSLYWCSENTSEPMSEQKLLEKVRPKSYFITNPVVGAICYSYSFSIGYLKVSE